jgi:acetylornithine deacetylase/succinyl-diaminopimelate desuccinylase-like protein
MSAAQTATHSVIDTLADLVRINSVNPAYEDGVSERGVAEYMQHLFRRYGIETLEQVVFPGRPNLIAKLPGADSSRRVVFEAHRPGALRNRICGMCRGRAGIRVLP